jgi:hypothetical protein
MVNVFPVLDLSNFVMWMLIVAGELDSFVTLKQTSVHALTDKNLIQLQEHVSLLRYHLVATELLMTERSATGLLLVEKHVKTKDGTAEH